MKQEELKQKIQDIDEVIHDLIMDGGVMSDSSLYAYLQTAEYAMSMAVMRTREYNEEFAKIHIDNLKQAQA